MESLFRCPLCQGALDRQEVRYLCPKGHSFDRSSAGYVHLLPPNKMHSKDPGDDKGMATARNRFLSNHHYRPLCDALAELAVKYAPQAVSILDSGCGEGYYSAAIYQALAQAGKEVKMAGVDLSKHALKRAAKREKNAEFAVASVYDIPVADQSAHIILNCFSPLALEEFLRILKPGGVYFYVVPGEKHLWELKEVLYENPYPNTEKLTPYEGFTYLEVRSVDGTIHLPDQQTISDLFQMTPYFWKTPKSGTEKLAALETLDTTISFRIHVFRKDRTMPKTIFFDLDGTLTDSGPGIMNCAQLMLDHYHIPYDKTLLRTFIGPPLRVRLADLGFSPEETAEATKIFRGQYNVTGKFENAPYPGMIDLLKTLKAQGHRLFVATSKPEVTAREVLDHFGMTEYFEEICGADLEKGRDTKDQVITYLKEKVGTLENVVMVGDTDYDVLGAKAHGIPTIGVTWGYGDPASMTACGAIAIANTMAKLYGLLRG